MSNWADTLARFSSVIRTGTGFDDGAIACPNYPAARGVEVYRNNYRGNLHDALAGAYPVIRRLVGEEFFRFLAKRFIEAYPSRSGNLHHYGGELADFLTRFENTRHLPYLPDMARLEWAYHRAWFAPDATPFDLARLAGIAPEAYTGLRWRLHPGCTLLVSGFPVAAIWRAHQDDADFRIDLDRGGEHLLVLRKDLRPDIAAIAHAELHWLAQLQQDTPMGAATEATLAAHSDFDLAAVLQRWLAQGVLVDFTVNQPPPTPPCQGESRVDSSPDKVRLV